MKTKMILGTLAATALMAAGLKSCKEQLTPLEQAEARVEYLNKQCEKDSLAFVSADSVKAKDKLARLEELKTEYLTGEKSSNDTVKISMQEYEETMRKLEAIQDSIKNGFNTEMTVDDLSAFIHEFAVAQGDQIQINKKKFAEMQAALNGDKNLKEMNAKIYDAQKEVDIATGAIFQRTKHRLEEAKKEVRVQKIIEKEKNGEALTNEENFLANNYLLGEMIKNTDDNIKMHQDIINELDRLKPVVNEYTRKDSIMNEFNKVAAEKN